MMFVINGLICYAIGWYVGYLTGVIRTETKQAALVRAKIRTEDLFPNRD